MLMGVGLCSNNWLCDMKRRLSSEPGAEVSQLRPRVRFHKPYVYTMEPGSDGSSGAKLTVKQAPFSAEGFASTGVWPGRSNRPF
jgi:hypothetical protein